MIIGRFHFLASVLLTFGFTSGQYITQLLGFLELPQSFICSDTPDFKAEYSCKPQSFCGKNDIFYRVNWTEDTSLHNWYEQIDLACESKAKVGFIGSILFIGWSGAAFVLPRIADIMGRKPVFCVSMLIQTFAYIGLFLSQNIYVTYFFMFLFGTASVGRCSISFLYLMELLPKGQQVLVGTTL